MKKIHTFYSLIIKSSVSFMKSIPPFFSPIALFKKFQSINDFFPNVKFTGWFYMNQAWIYVLHLSRNLYHKTLSSAILIYQPWKLTTSELSLLRMWYYFNCHFNTYSKCICSRSPLLSQSVLISVSSKFAETRLF